MTQGSETPGIPPLVDVTASGNKLTAQSLYEAFARGDVPFVLAGLDPQIEWTQAEGGNHGGTYRGPQAVLEHVFMPLKAEWNDYAVTPHQFVGDGDAVVVLGEYTGTSKATGRSMNVPFAHALRLRDGKVVQFTQYTDTVLLQRAIQP